MSFIDGYNTIYIKHIRSNFIGLSYIWNQISRIEGMFQWLIIGLVIWYFYRNYKKKQIRQSGNQRPYIRDEHMRSEFKPPSTRSESEDEYIDYEEVK